MNLLNNGHYGTREVVLLIRDKVAGIFHDPIGTTELVPLYRVVSFKKFHCSYIATYNGMKISVSFISSSRFLKHGEIVDLFITRSAYI